MAACLVNSRATRSNDAGTVNTTCCSANGASVNSACQASTRWLRNAVVAVMGETKGVLASDSHGRMGDCRSTHVLHSQLFAAATTRSGCSLAMRRAYSPTIPTPGRIEGTCKEGSSADLVKYKKEGNDRRRSTAPGATNCGIGRTATKASGSASGAKASTELVVPKSIPIQYVEGISLASDGGSQRHHSDATDDYCDKCLLSNSQAAISRAPAVFSMMILCRTSSAAISDGSSMCFLLATIANSKMLCRARFQPQKG